MVVHVYLCRHGDREDYDGDKGPIWKSTAASLVGVSGQCIKDPPLSALGHVQARDTGRHFQRVVKSLPSLAPQSSAAAAELRGRSVRILSSPYLRCIQTATPTAQALGVPISLEEGLSECHFSKGYLPTVQQRWAYFPHLDLNYERLYMPTANDDIHPQEGVGECESFPDGYFRRMLRFAPIFTEFVDSCNDGDVIIMFSHAASVALVASLLGESDIPWRMAPCGIFALERYRESKTWSLIGEDGGENAHVSSRSPGTFPWGFNEERRAKWMPIQKEILEEREAASSCGTSKSGGGN